MIFHLFFVRVFGQTNRPKIGLVLSGGAAKGIAHIGVLKVLEKAGITVDFIGGTSMGSIVGGLYALGYDANTLENLALNQDWSYLLSDEIPLSSISIEEKNDIRKYFLSVPSDGFRLRLPGGLKAGQNISVLLSGLIWPYHGVYDFKNLPIPFLCIATDIVEGKQVILDKGYLPDAIRASMAIPTIFTPVELDGRLLVDGGVVNNFPVQEVSDMGADYIIGVDCGFRAFRKEELNSISSIFEQSLYILSSEKSQVNKKLCNILIEPEFKENAAVSFSNTRELIKIGEDEALKYFDQLKHLADSIDGIYGKREKTDFKPELKTYVDKLEIEGLENVSKNLLLGKLKLSVPSYISLEELNTAISRAFGSQFFETVTYKIEDDGKSITLKIRVKEKPNMMYRVGGHYDNNFDASLLLNGTLRNAIIKGSKLIVDLKLGSNPAFETRYLVPTWLRGWKSGSLLIPEWDIGWIPDIELLFSMREYKIYEYSDGRRIAKYNYNNTSTGISLKSNVNNSMEAGFGMLTEFTRIKPDIFNQVNPDIIHNVALNLFGYFAYDSFDKFIFPGKGLNLLTKIEFVKDIDARQYSDIFRISFRFSRASPLSSKLTFFTNVYGGYLLGDSIPPDYMYFSGGLVQNDYKVGVFPFVGMELFEKVNRNALTIGFDFQYEIFRNHFIKARGNIGKTTEYFEDIFLPENIYIGYGLTYGLRSFIGPIEFSVMKNNLRNDILTYINIGYWF